MAPIVTILGLGPGNPRHRTLEAVERLAAADRILLRTAIHPGLDDLLRDPRVASCDDLYERGGSFDQVYAAIVDRLFDLASAGDVVYAVPGHPLVGERTVSMALNDPRSQSIEFDLVPGLSAVDVIASALRVDPMAAEAQIVDATELQRFVDNDPFNGGLPDVSPTRPVLLAQIYGPAVAAAAKLALGRVFPDEHPIRIVTSAGIAGEQKIVDAQLFELDRVAVDHLSSAWVPPMSVLEATRGALTLHRIAALLRAPGGCPWDREQTASTLRVSIAEEAYEVMDAIEESDPDHLAEELGDLLLLVSMQAQIADEAGDFSIGDVFDHVNRKLVRRHPHVFGSAAATTPDAVVETWDAVKASERAASGLADTELPPDPFDRLPRAMPVLQRVAKIARKRGSSPAPADPGVVGDRLLELVTALAAAGGDPERELERAYRRRAVAAVNDR